MPAPKISKQLLNWYVSKHAFTGDNTPEIVASITSLEALSQCILSPLNCEFGKPIITYGFTSHELKKFIQKNSSSGTSPSLDQHASHEQNSNGKQICSRGGAACDFFIKDVPTSDIVRFIVENLNYDRIYYYGNDRPVHVSVHLTDPLRHLQIMRISENGRRFPAKRAYGDNAKLLAESF